MMKMITQGTKLYRVFFELVNSGEVYSVVVEAASAFDAGDSVLTYLGKGYELIKVVGAKKSELS